MPAQNRNTLKAYFEAGDKPTEDQFIDLIDSFLNFLDDGIFPMQKVTINYTDFQPSSSSNIYIDCLLVPQGYQVRRIYIIPSERFLGGTISDSAMQLFDSSDSFSLVNSLCSLFVIQADTWGMISPAYTEDYTSISDINDDSYIRMYFVVTGATDGFNDLTQGSVDIYYSLDKMV